MALRRFIRFLLSYVLVGFVVAIGIVWLAPDWMQPSAPATSPRTMDEAPSETGASSDYPFSYADAVGRAAPSVVNIYTATRDPDPRNALLNGPSFDELFGERAETAEAPLGTSLGSGVLVSAEGHLLTNHHVIRGAERIQVLLADGRTAPARVVGTDPESDLAVLKVADPGLPHISLTASDGLQVGDVVFAIGNPFGVGQTVTQGIISALGRSELGLATFENFIQTDAAINPGNSGGALINARGEVIGINTAIFSESGSSTGIGFAIPGNIARAVLNDIIAHGRVIRGWIGVQVIDDGNTGALVGDILPDGPADIAGLRTGDRILEVEGEPIASVRELLDRVTRRDPGDVIELMGTRAASSVQWEITIAERPTDLEPSGPQRPPLR